MSSVVRAFLLFAIIFGNAAYAKSIHVLVLGEAASANCNSRLYGEQAGVYQIGKDGLEKPARDPLDWADCAGGSIWIPVGREMIRAGMAKRVVFMSIGMANSRAQDWIKGGRAFGRLESAMQVVSARKIKFDYVFWYQGMSDSDSSGQRYVSDLTGVIKNLIPSVPGAKWIIAQSAGCSGRVSNRILAAQRRVSAYPLFNRFLGPDLSFLENATLGGQCALTQDAQEKAAGLWVGSLVNAEAESRKYGRESLLFYFRQ